MKRSIGLLLFAACSGVPGATHPSASQPAPLSLAKDAQMVVVPAGSFIAGSTVEERTAAYDDYEQTAGQDVAREKKWFEGEDDRHQSRRRDEHRVVPPGLFGHVLVRQTRRSGRLLDRCPIGERVPRLITGFVIGLWARRRFVGGFVGRKHAGRSGQRECGNRRSAGR